MNLKPGNLLFFVTLITIYSIDGLNSSTSCEVSEFRCRSGQCIPVQLFCDARKDCSDGSDEPPKCSNCNTTLRGNVRTEYSFRIPNRRCKPKYLSYFINLVAAGGKHGDYVRLTFSSFDIGRLEVNPNSTSRSNRYICRDGFMQIIENFSSNYSDHNANNHGYCGQYYKEKVHYVSSSNNITVKVLGFSRHQRKRFNWYLTVKYKFLNRDYPIGGNNYGLRVSSDSTTCEYYLTNCDRTNCVVRSPNFPGMYPRNIRCRYLIRQMDIPYGKHTLIQVSQPNYYRMMIRYRSYHWPVTVDDEPRLWTDCDADVVSIHDGDSIDDPKIAQFCDSGPLEPVISRGPQMTIAFHSLQFATLEQDKFEMKVKVLFVDEDDYYLKNSDECKFIIDSSIKRQGTVRSPVHTLLPKTTCTYRFKSSNRYELLWIYFVSYHVLNPYPWKDSTECNGKSLSNLKLFSLESNEHNKTEKLIGNFCENNPPRMCMHARSYKNYLPIRPCTYPKESYLTSGPNAIIRYLSYDETSLQYQKSEFVARYEFVNTFQHGVERKDSLCDRDINVIDLPRGKISSPPNVFYYGRGGNTNLTCRYFFDLPSTKTLKITLLSFKVASRACRTTFDWHSSTYQCQYELSNKGSTSSLSLREVISDKISIKIGCFCSNFTSSAKDSTVLTGSGSKFILTFKTINMAPTEDQNDIQFSIKYEVTDKMNCASIVPVLNGSEGSITSHFSAASPHQSNICRWLIVPSPSKYIFVKVTGTRLKHNCSKYNRVTLFGAQTNKILSSICVQRQDSSKRNFVSTFSGSWADESSSLFTPISEISDGIIVEYKIETPGIMETRWLEVSKPFIRGANGRMQRNIDCVRKCDELNACIAPELWCDSVMHCPSGKDELTCSSFPILYVALGGGTLSLILVLFISIIITLSRKRQKLTDYEVDQDDDDLSSANSSQDESIAMNNVKC